VYHCRMWASNQEKPKGKKMSRRDYTAKMPWGETLTISADLDEASANIAVVIDSYDDGPKMDPTPYQTADARHRKSEAVMLAVSYCGREWYAQHTDRRDSAEILAEIESEIVVS